MRWLGSIARLEELRKVYKILAAIICGRDHFVELTLPVNIILELNLKREKT